MANREIVEAKPIMLAINLERPFPLGFGTLESLPRVLFHLRALEKGKVIEGIGEASIDFPFSPYDAWDIFWALSNTNLVGLPLNEIPLQETTTRELILKRFPAAFNAINMALDDAIGKAEGKSVTHRGQKRTGGKALASISFQDETALLVAEIEGKIGQGFIPKPKVGQGIDKDLATIKAVAKISEERNTPFVLDFNAQYDPEEFASLVEKLRDGGADLSRLVFLEQPTLETNGIEGLVYAKNALANCGYDVALVADESFVNMRDAIACARAGISLNYKINKVGGRVEALAIEQAAINFSKQGEELLSMVGGTFPTAIGRTYDQQVASLLETATLPGDGWEPSTDWFTGEKHLIREEFSFDGTSGYFVPQKGPGLGITPDWDKINKFRVDNPRKEYKKIRAGQNGDQLRIDLKPGQDYSSEYKRKSGKPADWNL